MSFGYEVAAALAVMREEKECYKNYLPHEAIETGNNMVQATNGLWPEVKEKIIELLKTEIPFDAPYASVWWYSVLLAMKKDQKLFEDFIVYVRSHQESFSVNTKYYLFYQLKSLRFNFSELDNQNIQVNLLQFFKEIVCQFSKEIENMQYIPQNKRNKDKVLVITEQFLEVQHGPTKTALDRCKCLMEQLHKKVLLINTTEILSEVGKIPFYNNVRGNCIEEKQNEIQQEWKGVSIPYFQCIHHMPEVMQLNLLVNEIRKMAPGCIVSIGGSGILCNLVNQMIPVLTIGLCPSDLEFTTCKYQTLGRKLNINDEKVLHSIGYGKNNVIESTFTSSLKPQTEVIKREDLGLENDKFLLVTVGARLDNEITEDFLNMLETVIQPEMKWVILGNFTDKKMLNKFPKIKKQIINLGFCNDILSRLEICDLYINPTRKGGGTSCVEALYKGIPVVSVAYGDVAINAGEEFCVENYMAMKDEILKYYSDSEFYKKKREKAMERVKLLLDTDTEFVHIIDDMKLREK